MLDLPKNKLIRRPFRVHNPNDHPLTVVLEPWAECYELEPKGTLDVVFIGSRNGMPEVVPYSDRSLTIYGWEGSEAFALKDGRLIGNRPAIDEIVRQELDLAKKKLQRTDRDLPWDEIAWIQKSLDVSPELHTGSQELARELAAILIVELAPCLVRSKSATELLWQIADRIVGLRGLVLASAEFESKETAVWSEHPRSLQELIRNQSLSVIPRRAAKSQGEVRHSPKPRRAESESDPNTS